MELRQLCFVDVVLVPRRSDAREVTQQRGN